jgi:F-type H+-transporting ATPase subunit epsilon
MALRLKVVTPDRTYYEGDAEAVVVPAWDGEMGILTGHAPLIARLGHGPLRVTPAGGGAPVVLAVFSGFLKVQEDDVVVLAQGAAEGAEIDAEKAKAALDAAREKVEATRPPRATEGAHGEALEQWHRARALLEAAGQKRSPSRT